MHDVLTQEEDVDDECHALSQEERVDDEKLTVVSTDCTAIIPFSLEV